MHRRLQTPAGAGGDILFQTDPRLSSYHDGSTRELQAEAAATGFPLETLGEVIRLIDLLNAFRAHPFLKDHRVLKGGAALNLFVFDEGCLRILLSVDEMIAGES